MNVTVIHEVWTDTVGAQLGLQWCRYSFPSPVLYGYRFIWRDDHGRVLPEATLPITRAAFVVDLIQKATMPDGLSPPSLAQAQANENAYRPRFSTSRVAASRDNGFHPSVFY